MICWSPPETAGYRFDVRFDQWTAFACAVAGRNLTNQEWQADFGTQPYRETCPPA